MFFFSSRRRHTRSKRDWSSDVCSSDLAAAPGESALCGYKCSAAPLRPASICPSYGPESTGWRAPPPAWRSEERRVGKECRARVAWGKYKKKRNKVHANARPHTEQDDHE